MDISGSSKGASLLVDAHAKNAISFIQEAK